MLVGFAVVWYYYWCECEQIFGCIGKLEMNREDNNKRGKCNVSSSLFLCNLHALIVFFLFGQNHQPFKFQKGRPFSHLVFDKWNPNEIKCGLNSNVIFFMWATCVNFDCPSQSLRFLVLLFCLFLLLFLKSYFVFSSWSGYNTIIWWFIYL